MRSRHILAGTLVALGCTLPAWAQVQGSSSTALALRNGNTSITGTTATDSASAAAATDQQLLGDVVAALAADPALEGASIDVRVEEGRVTLNGVAKDMAQQQQARAIADRVAGAANVTDRTTTGG